MSKEGDYLCDQIDKIDEKLNKCLEIIFGEREMKGESTVKDGDRSLKA